MHVHRTTISRILANGQPFAVDGGPGPREREVEIIAQRFQGDDVEMATLGALRSVGRKLDQLDTAKAASSGQSMAALVNQYVNLLQGLRRETSDPFLDALFADTDEECERYRAALGCIASGRSDGSKDFNAPRYTAEEAQQLAQRALNGNGNFDIEWVGSNAKDD